MKTERYEELLVRVVDSTATPPEREELMSWIADRPELRRELESHQAMKAVTDGWVGRLEADLTEDRLRESPVGRAERGLGVWLLILGTATLWGWAMVEGILDAAAPPAVRLGVGGMLAGTLVLFFHVIRTRLAARGSDPYEKVIR